MQQTQGCSWPKRASAARPGPTRKIHPQRHFCLNGNSFNIVRVPTPDLIFNEILYEDIGKGDLLWFPGANPGDTLKIALATSYLNFILTDKLVIAAKYWQPGLKESSKKKDAEVMSIFKEVFPEQEIRQLNPVTINHQGGGFHCYSYNEPRIN